jgi:hypothetical protein
MKPSNTQALQTATPAVDKQSDAIPAEFMLYCSVQIVSTGTAAGNTKLQGSNDMPPAGQMAPFVPTNWTDITNTTKAVTAGGTAMIEKTDVCYQWVRVTWSGGSGTGTITARLKSTGA